MKTLIEKVFFFPAVLEMLKQIEVSIYFFRCHYTIGNKKMVTMDFPRQNMSLHREGKKTTEPHTNQMGNI